MPREIRIPSNIKAPRLREIESGLTRAASIIQENGWCRDTLRAPSPGLNQPSRVCMMGAVQDSMLHLPRQDRYLAYDLVHQLLDGVPMQDYNDSQSNPKPVIRKLLQAAKFVGDRAEILESRAVD